MVAILTTDLANRRYSNKNGSPRKYTPESLLEVAKGYFQWAIDNPIGTHKVSVSNGETVDNYQLTPRLLLVSEFCAYAGMSRETLSRYRNDVNYSDIVEFIDSMIYSQKLQGAAVGLFKENIISRHLGLTDKKETTLNVESSGERLSESTGSMLEQLKSSSIDHSSTAIESTCETIPAPNSDI